MSAGRSLPWLRPAQHTTALIAAHQAPVWEPGPAGARGRWASPGHCSPGPPGAPNSTMPGKTNPTGRKMARNRGPVFQKGRFQPPRIASPNPPSHSGNPQHRPNKRAGAAPITQPRPRPKKAPRSGKPKHPPGPGCPARRRGGNARPNAPESPPRVAYLRHARGVKNQNI